MKICHVCSAECEDFAELCQVCGAELTEIKSADEPTDIMLENPVLAVSVEDVVTAEIYRDVLRDNGILFTCDSEQDGTMKVLFGGGFVAEDIYVEESELERARELYEEVLKSESEFEFFEENEFDFQDEVEQ